MFDAQALLIKDFIKAVEDALEYAPTVQKAFMRATSDKERKALSNLNKKDSGTPGTDAITVMRAESYVAGLQKMAGGVFVLNSAVNAAAKTEDDKTYLKTALQLK